MLLRPLRHIRNNLVGYIALFVALGGTSYAAFSLPAGSVGARQLRNHAITATKLNPTSVAASIRAWATLVWSGAWRVQASSADIRVRRTTQGEVVSWAHTRFPRNCIASVTPTVNFLGGNGSASVDGYVTTSFEPQVGFLQINGLTPQGANQVQNVHVLIVCPSPGSQRVNR
jgi:hypothetical protein